MIATDVSDRKAHVFLLDFLTRYGVSESMARGILKYLFKKIDISDEEFDSKGLSENSINILKIGVDLFVRDKAMCVECKHKLDELTGENRMVGAGAVESHETIKVEVTVEDDIVTARNMARSAAEDMGFSKTEQIKVATAVSEMARNIYKYAGSGYIDIDTVNNPRPGIRITAVDEGPGIENLDLILSGKYKSKSGLGLGILGCKRLMDDFDIITRKGKGTKMKVLKYAH